MTTHCRLISVLPVLLSAAFVFVVPAGAIELAQAPTPPSTRPAAQKPKPTAPKPAQAPAQPQAPSGEGGPQPQLLGQFGDWGAYAATPNGRKVCFALAKPARAQTNPPNRPRDAAFLFIASRPAERVKDEVSVIFGYAFKPNAEASVEVGGASYAMYTQADGGWIKNAAEEPRLIESMRKAADITVKGMSSHGTSTTDLYSLKGLAQALDRVAQECR